MLLSQSKFIGSTCLLLPALCPEADLQEPHQGFPCPRLLLGIDLARVRGSEGRGQGQGSGPSDSISQGRLERAVSWVYRGCFAESSPGLETHFLAFPSQGLTAWLPPCQHHTHPHLVSSAQRNLLDLSILSVPSVS